MHIISLILDLVLAGYVAWEVVQFLPDYRKLKQAIANGDAQARPRVYRRAIVFECVSALLALTAFGFDWNKLNPKSLALDHTRLIERYSHISFDWRAVAIMLLGMALATIGLVIVRRI